MSNVYNGSLLNECDITNLILQAVSRRVIIDMDCCNVVVVVNPSIIYWDSLGLIGESSKVSNTIAAIIKNCGSLEVIPCKSNSCLAATIAQGITDNYLRIAAEVSDRLYEDTKRTLLEALTCEGELSNIGDTNFIDSDNNTSTQAQVIRKYGQYCC